MGKNCHSCVSQKGNQKQDDLEKRQFNRQFQKTSETIQRNLSIFKEKAAEKLEIVGQKATVLTDKISTKAQEAKKEVLNFYSEQKQKQLNQQATDGNCCEYCKESNNLAHFENHTIDNCPFITSTCFDCGGEFPLSQLNDHIQNCNGQDYIIIDKEEEEIQQKQTQKKDKQPVFEEEKKEMQQNNSFDEFEDLENFGDEIDESNTYNNKISYNMQVKNSSNGVLKMSKMLKQSSFEEVPQIVECKICKIIIEKSQLEDHMYAHSLQEDQQPGQLEMADQNQHQDEFVIEENNINEVENEEPRESWNPQDDINESFRNVDVQYKIQAQQVNDQIKPKRRIKIKKRL